MEKQISITKIKIRHSQILLFLNCPKKPETLQGELRFQNAWLNFCHPVAFYPVGKSLVCPINTDKLEYGPKYRILYIRLWKKVKSGTISFQSISAPVFITEKIPNLESF